MRLVALLTVQDAVKQTKKALLGVVEDAKDQKCLCEDHVENFLACCRFHRYCTYGIVGRTCSLSETLQHMYAVQQSKQALLLVLRYCRLWNRVPTSHKVILLTRLCSCS
jgi:hypothetical protein